ncbi:uncharacterized protein LOC144149498 [Haemaphysalis longicornis]
MDELGRCATATREATLAASICRGGRVIALANPVARRLPSLRLGGSQRRRLVVIPGQHIGDHPDLVAFLRHFSASQDSRTPNASTLPPDALGGIRLMEPDVVWANAVSGVLSRRSNAASASHDLHMNPAHVYTCIVGLYKNASGRKQPESTRLLAFTEDLQEDVLVRRPRSLAGRGYATGARHLGGARPSRGESCHTSCFVPRRGQGHTERLSWTACQVTRPHNRCGFVANSRDVCKKHPKL